MWNYPSSAFVICNLSFVFGIFEFWFCVGFFGFWFWCWAALGTDILFLHSGQMPHPPTIPDSTPVSLLFLLSSHSDGMPYHSAPTTFSADVALSLRERRALSSEKAVCSPSRPRKSTPSSPCSICAIYMQSAYIPIYHLSGKQLCNIYLYWQITTHYRYILELPSYMQVFHILKRTCINLKLDKTL